MTTPEAPQAPRQIRLEAPLSIRYGPGILDSLPMHVGDVITLSPALAAFNCDEDGVPYWDLDVDVQVYRYGRVLARKGTWPAGQTTTARDPYRPLGVEEFAEVDPRYPITNTTTMYRQKR